MKDQQSYSTLLDAAEKKNNNNNAYFNPVEPKVSK